MTLTDFLDAIEDKAPPAPIDQVIALERELTADLPDDYRRFLIECNGGYVGGALWFTGPTPDGSAADAGVHHIGGFREEKYFSLPWTRDVYRGRIPHDLLWIMDDPFGNAICLAFRGAHRGSIFFWDHEREPERGLWDGAVDSAGNVQILARSFTAFVAGLRSTPQN